MTTDALIDSIGRVSDALILETDELRHAKRKKHPWVKWTALAACLALILTWAYPIFRPKGGKMDPTQAIAALEFNGAYYEAVRLPEVLEKYGLPGEITSELAGPHLSYLQSDGGVGYEEVVGPTDIELYTYAPSPCRGVLILRDGETWYAALFCNFYIFDDNTHQEFSELYRVYGVEQASDLASVTEMDWRNEKTLDQPVTDRQALNLFYDLTTSLQSYGNADFQAITFGGIAEENAPKAHTDFADDRRNLRIETTDGLRFYISFFPSYNWMRDSGSYYRMDQPTHDWINSNLG